MSCLETHVIMYEEGKRVGVKDKRHERHRGGHKCSVRVGVKDRR